MSLLKKPCPPAIQASAVLALALCALPLCAQSLPHEFEGLGANAPRPSSSPGMTPLQWARLTPDATRMEPVLAQGADARLIQAVTRKQWALALKLLKDEGASANPVDEVGTSPLALAAGAGQEELVRELLLRGANPNVVGADGFTPLGAAAKAGQVGVVQALLKAGARRDDPGVTGQSPLHLACATGQLTVIDALLRAGADPALTNTHGQHGLDVAAYHGQAAAMLRLVAAGLPLDTPDELGLNALHAAALGRQVELAAWLQQQGLRSPGPLTDLLLAKMQEPWPVD